MRLNVTRSGHAGCRPKRITWRRSAGICSVLMTLGAIGTLGGCTSLVIGAGATVGVASMQERGLNGAVSDTKITAELWQKYLESDSEIFKDIQIEVVEGEVLLAGKVTKPEDEMKAVQLAWQTNGVTNVINRIDVGKEVGLIDSANDLLITARLKAALMFDTSVYAINYSIETVNGTVYIMGIAQNDSERKLVISHARNTSYVKNVISYVRLKDDPTRQRS